MVTKCQEPHLFSFSLREKLLGVTHFSFHNNKKRAIFRCLDYGQFGAAPKTEFSSLLGVRIEIRRFLNGGADYFYVCVVKVLYLLFILLFS